MRTPRIDRAAIDHAVRDFAGRLASDLDIAIGVLESKRRDVASARELLAGVRAELHKAADAPMTVVPDPCDARRAHRALRRMAAIAADARRPSRADSEA